MDIDLCRRVVRELGWKNDVAEQFEKTLKNEDPTGELRRAFVQFEHAVFENRTRMDLAARSRVYAVSMGEQRWMGGRFAEALHRLHDVIQGCDLGTETRLGQTTFLDETEPTAAMRNRVLYVFPFFLTPSRRRLFGVIPYGRQCVAGVLLHQSHPSYEHWLELTRAGQNPLDLLTRESTGLAVPAARDGLSWIESAIRATEECGGAVVWCGGYVFYDIVSEALESNRAVESWNCLARCQRMIHIHDLQGFLDGSYQIGIPDKEQCDPRHSVVLVDPAAPFDARRLESLGFHLATWAHGVDVPVGIGFTLPFLPALLLHGVAATLLRHGIDCAKDVKPAFEIVGIRDF